MSRLFLTLGSTVLSRLPCLRPLLSFAWIPFGSLAFKFQYWRAENRGTVYLQVACGGNYIEGWLNTDVFPHLALLFLDATKRFPIKSNSVLYIFSEHFIEHISRCSVLSFFSESFRVLKPGGALRISTPDLESLTYAYLNNTDQISELNQHSRKLGYRFAEYSVDVLNRVFMEDRHVCLYDSSVLEQMLTTVGFINITRHKVGESCHSELTGIERHEVGTVEDKFTCVIEAEKPL